MKVVRAFNILTGELDSSKEKGYCAALYEGLECCCSSSGSSSSGNSSGSENESADHHHQHNHSQQQQTPHIHVLNEKQFVANLIYKAESEIQGR